MNKIIEQIHLSDKIMEELYKNYFQLYRESQKCVGKLDKTYKYTTGEQLLYIINNFWKEINSYKLTGNKQYLIKALSNLEIIKIQLRFLNDEQKISNGYYSLFADFITNIEDVCYNIQI